MFKNGDILLVADSSWLSRAIRWVLKEPAEPARFSHVGIIAAPTQMTLSGAGLLGLDWGERDFKLVEALSEIEFNNLAARLEEYPKAVVFRPPLSYRDRDRVALMAMQYVGSPYSYRRLLSFLLPASFLKSLPLTDVVCSTFVASLFFPFGIVFEGKPPGAVSPDDIDDTARKGNWEVVYQKGLKDG